MRRLLSTLLLAVAFVCGAAGCGGTTRTVPVEGVVLLDDQPLAGASVVFTPVDDEGGQPATALTATDGTFSLNNADGRKGAVPGNYKVMVSKAEAMELPGGQVPKTPEEIEKMMMKGRGTDRKSPPPAKKSSSGVPARYRSADTPLRQTVPPEGKVIIKLDSKGR